MGFTKEEIKAIAKEVFALQQKMDDRKHSEVKRHVETDVVYGSNDVIQTKFGTWYRLNKGNVFQGIILSLKTGEHYAFINGLPTGPYTLDEVNQLIDFAEEMKANLKMAINEDDC